MAVSSCSLLGGIFSLSVQAFLAATCVVTLVYKRAQESHQRDWLVWTLDVSKQGFGSSMGHMSNLFIATVLSNGTSDECQWYCLCYLTDVTLGTFLNVSVLALVESFLVPDASSSIFKFGEYGDPPNLCVWLAQLLVWLAIIVTSKALIVLFLFLCADMLINGSSQVFAYLEAYPRIELVVVMVCIPFVFNILAFWVTDSFLKKTDFESITQTDVREYQGCSSRTSIVCHHYGTHPSLCVTAGLGDLGGRSVESGSSKC